MNLEPIHVPYQYRKDDRPEQKVIFALGQLGEASAEEVYNKLKKVNSEEALSAEDVSTILKRLFDHGMIKGDEHSANIKYNLSKIEKQNSGYTDIDTANDNLKKKQ